VTWGTGVAAEDPAPHVGAPAPAQVSETASPISVNDLKGVSAQAAKLTEWLKLALDEPHLLQTLGAATNLGVLVSGPAGVGKTTLVRAVCAGRRLVEIEGPEVGALTADETDTTFKIPQFSGGGSGNGGGGGRGGGAGGGR